MVNESEYSTNIPVYMQLHLCLRFENCCVVGLCITHGAARKQARGCVTLTVVKTLIRPTFQMRRIHVQETLLKLDLISAYVFIRKC